MLGLVNAIKKSMSKPTDDQDEKLNMDEEFCIEILLSTGHPSKMHCKINVPKAPNSDTKTWRRSYESVLNAIETQLTISLESQNLGLFAGQQEIRSPNDFNLVCCNNCTNSGIVKLVTVK